MASMLLDVSSALLLYRKTLIDVRGILETMPAVDCNADPDDTSPPDGMAHVTGLAIQAIDRALNHESEKQ